MSVVRAKLLPPPVPVGASWPTGLVERLAARTDHAQLTLLRADGGSGKTTLARALAEACGRPWGWCRLDDHDDLVSTAELLGASLAGADERLAHLAEAGHRAGTAGVRATAELIAEGIVEGAGVVVVIDDAHRPPDPAVAELLAAIVELGPPDLHLVVTTRTELPGLGGARSIALGEVVALDSEVLRMDVESAGRMLRALAWCGTEEDVHRIVERTGGWVLGIRLMAFLGDDDIDVSEVVQRYLADEVLGDRDAVDVEALENLSVLDDLDARAVAAVAGIDPADAWLDGLRRDLPLLTTPVGTGTVRLHDVLRETLVARLRADPTRAAQAHRRAATVAPTWQARVDHLLAGGDAAGAADVLAVTARDHFPRPAPLGQIAERGRALPDDVRSERPWLRVVEAVAMIQRNPGPAVLDLLEPAMAQLPPGDLLARWAALRHGMTVAKDVPAWSARMLELESEPGFADLPPAVRVDHEIAMAHGMYFAGRPDEVCERHERAGSIARGSRDPGAFEVLAQHQSPFLAQVPGGVDRIARWTDWVGAEVVQPTAVVQLGQRAHRASVALYRGDLDAALAEAVAGRPLFERHPLTFLGLQLDWALASAWLAREDLAPAADLLDDRRRGPGPLARAWLAMLARIRAAQGDDRALERLVDEPLPELDEPQHVSAWVAGQILLAEHARSDGRPSHAVDILTPVARAPRLPLVVPSVGVVRLDLAVALLEDGRDRPAVDELAGAIDGLAARDMIGIVASHGCALLPVLDRALAVRGPDPHLRAARAVFDHRAAPIAVAVGGGDELSSREVEILRLVAGGASNREIADRLYISVNTVKTHVRHVFAKLGVANRAAAARSATELGIGGS